MGPIVGGIFVALLPFFLEELHDLAFILKGVALILILMFAPQGIAEVLSRPIKSWRRRQLERASGSAVATRSDAGMSSSARRAGGGA